MNLTDLKNEILNDPEGLGYAGKTLFEKANLINALTSDTIFLGVLESYKVKNAFDIAELKNLSDSDTRTLLVLLAGGEVDMGSANTRAAFTDIFPAQSTTRANLVAIAKRNISRAEKLFGADIVVSYWEIGQAEDL